MGFWFFILLAGFIVVIIFSDIIQWYSGSLIIRLKVRDKAGLIQRSGLFFLLVLFIIGIMWYNVKIVIIDTVNKKVILKDIILRIGKTYSFTELDGYFETTSRHLRSGMPFETLGLMKEGKALWKIDSFFYSNLKEMQTGFKDLKYLGYIKSDWFGNLKM